MHRSLSSVSLLALTISALAISPAEAQVSAAEIWSEWQRGAAETGQSLTADVTETADGLLLENLATRTVSDDTATSARVDRVALVEQDDGTLSVEVSTPYTLTLTFPADAGEGAAGAMVSMDLLLTHEGLDVTVAGAPEARSYSYSADAITVVEGEINSDDGAPQPEVDLEIAARDIRTVFSLTGPAGERQGFETVGTTGSLTGRLAVQPPPGETGALAMTFAIGDLATEASGARGALAAMQRAQDRLPEGAEIRGTATYGFSQLEIAVDDPEADFDASFANEGGSFGFSLSDDRLVYDIAATGARLRMTGGEIPVPVEIGSASSALSLSVPLAASDTPSDASLRIDYRDVVLGETLWAMIDPSGQVPRDPLTLILEAAAQVQLLADLMGADAMAMEAPPGELRALTVSELDLSFGATSLSGTADMTFGPGAGMPRPVGRADLALRGGNALLDVLEGAALVSSDQAAVMRGVAGMFTRPGARPDTLETTIEFLEDGTVTANGLTLQ
jgi:hypothetical protein